MRRARTPSRRSGSPITNSAVASAGRRDDCSEIFEKKSTIGAADGSIIAAIIVTQMPRYQPSEPRSVPGPASIPRIRATTSSHAASVTPRKPATTPGRKAPGGDRGSLALMWRVSAIHRTGGNCAGRQARATAPSRVRRYETVKLPNMVLSCGSQ